MPDSKHRLTPPGDARDGRHCRECVERVATLFGGIDEVPVNRVGERRPQKSPTDIDRALLQLTFETSVYR